MHLPSYAGRTIFDTCSWQPRTYTREFSQRMAQLYPHMVDVTPPPTQDAPAEFKRLWDECGDLDKWKDANLAGVVRYLVGSKGLNVPIGWDWIIPESV